MLNRFLVLHLLFFFTSSIRFTKTSVSVSEFEKHSLYFDQLFLNRSSLIFYNLVRGIIPLNSLKFRIMGMRVHIIRYTVSCPNALCPIPNFYHFNEHTRLQISLLNLQFSLGLLKLNVFFL